MKKGLLFVASTLLVGSLVSCGGGNDSKGPQHKPVTTVSATYTAKYKLDVETTKPGEKAFARDVDDIVTVEADYTKGNLYLHAKRVGTEMKGTVAPDTYEALLWKDGANYKWLTTTMGNPVTIADEQTAYAKMGALLRKVSFRSGGWIDNETFTYDDEIGKYEHHHFLLDSTTIPFEDMDKPTVTGNGARTSKFDMTYVGYQTDAGTSELHNDPKAATVKVDIDNGSRVTGFNVEYNGAWMDMPIGNPAPRLTLSGSRNFVATYDEEITKLDTISHSTVTGKVEIKDHYKGGTVKVYSSANGQLTPRKELKNGDDVEVDSWITIEPTPATSAGGIKSVLLNTSSQSVVEGKYVFEAVQGKNEVKVVFIGSEPMAKILYDFNTEDFFSESQLVSFLLDKGAFKDEKPVTGNSIEIVGERWAAIKVDNTKFVEGVNSKNVILEVTYPDGSKDGGFLFDGIPTHTYFCAKLKAEGNITIKLTKKTTGPEVVEDGIKVTAPVAVPGFALTVGHSAVATSVTEFGVSEKTAVPFGHYLGVNINDNANVENVTVKLGDKTLTKASAQTGWFYSIKITADDFTKDQNYDITLVVDPKVVIADADKAVLSFKSATEGAVTAVTFKSFAPEGAPAPKAAAGGEHQGPQFNKIEGNKLAPTTTEKVAIFPVLAENTAITSVKVNGYEASSMFGIYYFSVPVAGKYVAVIETETVAKATITAPEGVTCTVQYCDAPNFTDLKDVVSIKNEQKEVVAYQIGNKAGRYFAIKITCPDKKVIDKVTCTFGEQTKNVDTFGTEYYLPEIKDAGTYTIAITIKDAPAAQAE